MSSCFVVCAFLLKVVEAVQVVSLSFLLFYVVVKSLLAWIVLFRNTSV